MSQHVIDTCDEGDGQWLPLTEFAVRSGISTSTIRRKIKSNSLQYRLENGRYLILYRDKVAVARQEALEMPRREPVVAPAPEPKSEPVSPPRVAARPLRAVTDESVLPFMDRAVQMVSGAFEQTLREKDERIRLLEKQNQELQDRLNELRILVRALEEKYEVRY